MDTEFDCLDYDSFALYDPAFYFDQEKISNEEFNLFYTNERKLFHRLVRKLGRNVDESKHAVAFLIWLERIRYSRNSVHKVTAWPFHLVDQLANEIAGLLRFLEREDIGDEYVCSHYVRKLCSRPFKLFEFRRKRTKILEGVSRILSEVCTRDFEDILTGESEFVDEEGDTMWLAYINPVIMPPRYHNVAGGFPRQGFRAGGFPQQGFRGNLGSGNSMAPAKNIGNVLEVPKADMQLVNGCTSKPDVAADDRTIFFENSSQGMYMQDVSSDEQPVYARMVCRSAAIIPNIAPNRKTNYLINGKRILATKYK